MSLDVILLIAAVGGLLVGPLVHSAAAARPASRSLLDGFVLVSVGGLVLGHVLPSAVHEGGWWTLLAAAAGLWGPTWLEARLHSAALRVHRAALLLAVLGLVGHATVDGVALGTIDHGDGALALAVILHRLPVALIIWALVVPSFGAPKAWGALLAMSVGTIAGWALGPGVIGTGAGVAWLQALVGGSLLHVLIHTHADESSPTSAGIGALLGLLLVFVVEGTAHEHEAAGAGGDVAHAFLMLALESAPALLLAYLMAGLVHVYLPKAGLAWLSRGGALQQAGRGVAFGLPLPLCSCGVVPVYRSLVVRGAPPTAAMAFFVATPELGLDAVFLSIPLLGPEITIARVAAAAAVALLIGLIVGPLAKRAEGADAEEDASPVPTGLVNQLEEAFHVGFGSVLDHTMPWILFGLGVAAFIDPVLSQNDVLSTIPAWAEVAFFALLGMPAYVCASGATPLVAVLIANGVSPGAGVAFLLTGPATNVTTFGVLKELHGSRAALAFGAAMAGLAIGVGYLINGVFPDLSGAVPQLEHVHGTVFQRVCLVGLALATIAGILRRGPRHFVNQLLGSVGAHDHDHDHHDHAHDHAPTHAEDSCCH